MRSNVWLGRAMLGLAVLLVVGAVALTLDASARSAPARAHRPPLTAVGAMHRVFGWGAHYRHAACIAGHESTGTAGHFNPRAVSRTSDYGLFQINGPTWVGKVIHYGRRRMRVSMRYIFRPLDNARAAYIISQGGRDWGPWTTHRYC